MLIIAANEKPPQTRIVQKFEITR